MPEPDKEPAPEPQANPKRELFLTPEEVAIKKARPSQPPANNPAPQVSPTRVLLMPAARPVLVANAQPPAMPLTSLQQQPLAKLLAMPVQHSIPVPKVATVPTHPPRLIMQAPAAAHASQPGVSSASAGCMPARTMIPPALVHRIIPQAKAMPPPTMPCSLQPGTPEKTVNFSSTSPCLAAQGMLQNAAAAMLSTRSPQPVKMELSTPKSSPGMMLKPSAAKTPSFAPCAVTAKAFPATPSTFKPGVPPLPGANRPIPTPARTAAAPSCKQELQMQAVARPITHTAETAARPTAYTGETAARPAAGETAARPAACTGETAARPAAYTGETAARPAAHTGETAARPAAHTGETAARPATHTGETAARPAAQTTETAARPAAQTGETAARPAAHLGETAARPAAHLGETAARPAAHTGEITAKPATTPLPAITDGREIGIANPIPKAGILRRVTWADQDNTAGMPQVPAKANPPAVHMPAAAPAASAPSPASTRPKSSSAAAAPKASNPVPATSGNNELLQEAERINVNPDGAATSPHFLGSLSESA